MTDFITFRGFVITAIIALSLLSGFGVQQLMEEHKHLGKTTQRLEQLVRVEAMDREQAVLKNVEARKADCEANNSVRAALTENVTQNQKSLPLLLKLIPSLNDKRVLKLTQESVERQLKAFKPVNCVTYSLRSVPHYETQKLSLQQQQNALSITQNELHNDIREQANARVITVRQRCELTGEIVKVLEHYAPHGTVTPFQKSYTECKMQLHSVEKLAHQTNG